METETVLMYNQHTTDTLCTVEHTEETMNESLVTELLKLTPAERIQLAEDLWDSVAAHPESLPPITDEQRTEIERRLAEHRRDPSSAVSLEQVRTRLWSRLG